MFLTSYPLHKAAQNTHTYYPRQIDTPSWWHNAVMALFPKVESDTPRHDMNILYRLERPINATPHFLIQSTTAPTRFTNDIQTKEITYTPLQEGQHVRFTTTLNAVKRTKDGVTPVAENDMAPWLENKLRHSLADISLIDTQRTVKKNKGAFLQMDTIEGIGRVNDSDLFHYLRTTGVGRERSYGCGLITALPIN